LIFLFGGCIYDEGFERDESRARTSNTLYTFDLNAKEWKKPKLGSSEVPSPRWHHTATRFDSKLVIFGGFQDDSKRLNDVWVLDTNAYKWTQPIKLKSESEISPDTSLRNRLGPSPFPRGEHAAAKIGEKLYIFGGYGGHGFARRDFNDLYCLNVETWSWQRVEYNLGLDNVNEDEDDDEEPEELPVPQARSGHKMAASGSDKLVIHGGWCSKEQYNDVWVIDLNTRIWTEVIWPEDAPSGPARWSHGSLVVNAIPSPQLYIWGGLTGALSTGKKPSGTYMNDMRLFNFDTNEWTELPFTKKMRPRCDTNIEYRNKTGEFFVFGGWSNKWYNDLWRADMNQKIGPPYNLASVEPTYGSIKGNTVLKLVGVKFPNTRNIKVQFDAGDNYTNEECMANYVSETELTCETPNLEAFLQKSGRKCNLSVSIDGGIFTIYHVDFEFFTVTSAVKSIMFGPGLIDGVPHGKRVEFIILAKDRFGDSRSYGGDEFTIAVERLVVVEEAPEKGEGEDDDDEDDDDEDSASGSDEEGGEEKAGEEEDLGPQYEAIPSETVDSGLGYYTVSYTAEVLGDYRISIEYNGTFGGTAGHVAASPYELKIVDGSDVEDSYGEITGDVYQQKLNSIIKEFTQKIKGYEIILQRPVADGDVKALLDCKSTIFAIQTGQADMLGMFQSSRMAVEFLSQQGKNMTQETKYLDQSGALWKVLSSKAPEKSKEIKQAEKATGKHVKGELDTYVREAKDYRYNFGTKPDFWRWDITHAEAMQFIKKYEQGHALKTSEFNRWYELAIVFDMESDLKTTKKAMAYIDKTLLAVRDLWGVIKTIREEYEIVSNGIWDELDTDAMESQSKRMVKSVRKMPRDVRGQDAFDGIADMAKNYMVVVPLIAAILHPSMRPRHWDLMREKAGKDFEDPLQNPKQKLSNILGLGLHTVVGEVEDISDQALKEEKMEKQLAILKENWVPVVWCEEQYQEGSDISLLRISDDDFEMLENDQLTVQGMMGSRFLSTFEKEVTTWQKELAGISENTNLIGEVQRLWSYLEPLFIGSEEVKKELAEDAARFVQIDIDVKKMLREAKATKSVIRACNKEGMYEHLELTEKGLNICKRSLMDFLDAKRRQFPRFYFTSEADLLDILSNGNVPSKIAHHVTKVFLKVKAWQIDEIGGGQRPMVPRLFSTVGGEKMTLDNKVQLNGKPEVYLQSFLDELTSTLRTKFHECWESSEEKERVDWIMEEAPDKFEKNETKMDPRSPAQLMLLCSFIQYVIDVEKAIPSGKLKQYNALQKKQLSDLVNITINPKLTKNERQRVMCMITMDAHNRDIVAKLIREEVDRIEHFQWQSQLKPRRDPNNDNLPVYTVLNGLFPYGFEYIGNDGRLVVTPLTDRIYVTSTVGLYLKMGVAPAGPAGTGKTETVKDLSMNFGYTIYVFNCSPEMDYISMGNVFKGLGATGSWGCFDEFNRLRVEVLSVVTVQFKALCDGLKADQHRVTIEGDEVDLIHSVGVFITMNPGYIGRAELPEGLKALFRPMTVMVPDLVLICENMLMAEGFQDATALASKFYGLYSLLNDLLSKQLHYDWGLRAVKSVLRVAGGFKRAEPDVDEQIILCRALRDFNTPKIVAQDWVIFFGLLGDLFPGIDPPRKRDMALEDCIAQACDERGLWKDEYFQRKCVELSELMAIRHCVFVMGPPAAGKSETWRTLAKAVTISGQKTKVQDINPKSITPQELYGYITLATREWKDGLLSKIMRDLGNEKDENPKWIILDGDLDTNWIESMNSVMDMNKTLTLASNERIPLKPHMKMMFEIRDLRFASLATVSRAGVLYISTDGGEQWRSLISSWVDNLLGAGDGLKNVFHAMFKEYCADTLLFIKADCKSIVPLEDMAYIMSLLYMLDTMIGEEYCEEVSSLGSEQEIRQKIEPRFVFAAVWAFGASMFEFEGIDYSEKFSKWWLGKFKNVRLPTRGSVFELYLDTEHEEGDTFVPWSQSKYFYPVEYKAGNAMESITIPTPESAANAHWVISLMHKTYPVMLVGPAGCGKTQLVKGILKNEDEEVRKSATINFNFYTSSAVLQETIQGKIVKRVGSNFGPPGKAKMVFFIDDFNLPEVDIYDTQSAIALMRQVMEYKRWFDRVKLGPINIQDCQYIAAMNPTAGSFYVNPRLQRHFVTMAMDLPGATSMLTIFTTYLEGHLKKFPEEVRAVSANLIQGAMEVHALVIQAFRKSAINFHYEFNLRHLQNVFQGLLMSTAKNFKDPSKFVLLWCHESERIYGDRLVNKTDNAKFKDIIKTTAKKKFSSFNADISAVYADNDPSPLIFCPFAKSGDLAYNQAKSMTKLTKICNKSLSSYNDSNAVMNLVLFEDAVKHICRISRIVTNPGGHCLCVGVGGSGKRSLSRLAAFILGYGLKTITISQTYGIADLKEDLQKFYLDAGVKNLGTLFLFTDSQITNERFLVYLNDLLASGNIPDLYQMDERDEIINSCTKACKAAGLIPEPDIVWDFFLSRIRANLHMSLCFSPVGDAFRNRAMKFPAIISSTVIDWFQEWPEKALFGVATEFLADEELGAPYMKKSIVSFMPYAFQNVNSIAKDFLEVEKRSVYTTPKSFLECIKLYRTLLDKKREQAMKSIERLENGCLKLNQTAASVQKLSDDLEIVLADAELKKNNSEAIAAKVAIEKAGAEEETAKADIEKQKAQEIEEDVTQRQGAAEAVMAEAQPAVDAAMAALDTLNKKDLGEAKTMSKAPEGVDDIFAAVAQLLAGITHSTNAAIAELAENIICKKNGAVKDTSWGASKKSLLTNISVFLTALLGYKQCIETNEPPEANFKHIRHYLKLEHFDADIIRGKNSAAAGLCAWVQNIVIYRDIHVKVEPLRIELEECNERLAGARASLAKAKETLDKLNALLAKLRIEFDQAESDKADAIMAVEKGEAKLDLAQRLTRALDSEGGRWMENIKVLEEDYLLLSGDVLLAAAFISYIGPFTKEFREHLLNDCWTPFMKTACKPFIAELTPEEILELKPKKEDHDDEPEMEDAQEKFVLSDSIPMSDEANPLNILTYDAEVALWQSQNLPSDKVSTENATIVANTDRWPVLIDPQLQAIAWIREKEKDNNLDIVRIEEKQMLRKLERAMENGESLMIENLKESIPAILDPVISRATVKKGRKFYVKVGDSEVELHPKFKLFLHTKLSNPHFSPEIQAECALINFTVTPSGLADQLLNLVVKMERPDLAEQRLFLIKQQNGFKVRMKELEDSILHKIATAEGDITEDRALIESLENTKVIANDIAKKQIIAAATAESIDITSEKYRTVAERGSLLFFLLNSLFRMHTYYIYNLEAFILVLGRSVTACGEPEEILRPKLEALSPIGDEAETEKEEGGEDAKEVEDAKEGEEVEEEPKVDQKAIDRALRSRCKQLIAEIQMQVFNYMRRGLFESDKLVISTLLTLKVMIAENNLNPRRAAALVRQVENEDMEIPESLLEIIDTKTWKKVAGLEMNFAQTFTGFGEIMGDMQDEYSKWLNLEQPENKAVPGYKDIDAFNKLLILKALRPDRLVSALRTFVGEQLGENYVTQMPFDMMQAFSESDSRSPIFFALFPGVDPTTWVEDIGFKLGYTLADGNFVNISMGEGQEPIAKAAIDKLTASGGWLFLQNLHLMEHWTPTLERLLDEVFAGDSLHKDFRVFLSAEPPVYAFLKNMPEFLMMRAIKVCNEAPSDVKSNLRATWAEFNPERIESCKQVKEFRGCLATLCFYHGIILGRRRFGQQGWSRAYSFNLGDLNCCANVLEAYLNEQDIVPWEDFRYIFGQIMYGGHITDSWDRRTNETYLDFYYEETIFKHKEIAPGYKAPDAGKLKYAEMLEYVEKKLPQETPLMFQMHPNVEIGFLTATQAKIWSDVVLLGGLGGASAGIKKAEEDTTAVDVPAVIEDCLARLPDDYNMIKIMERCKPLLKETEGPYSLLLVQELTRMNTLLSYMRKSLSDLQKGLNGELNMSEAMDDLRQALSIDQVPGRNPFHKTSWESRAWWSKKPLPAWYMEMEQRNIQLKNWVGTLALPTCMWFSGLFNPMAFLTAVMQVTGRRQGYPLDQMTCESHVAMITDKDKADYYPADGAFVHGIFLEGARWGAYYDEDEADGDQDTYEVSGVPCGGHLCDSKLKDLLPMLPILYFKAVIVRDTWEPTNVGYMRHNPNVYDCPLYMTTFRGPTYTSLCTLKSIDPTWKWTLAGVAMILQEDA
jgi:dynein heavy chain